MEVNSDTTEEGAANPVTRKGRRGQNKARMTSNEKALIRAVKSVDFENARRLITEENAEVNFRDIFTQTPLMRACAVAEGDATEVVELLLSFGAEVNAQDKRGRSPLMFASMDEGKEDIVDLLIQTGKANPNLQDEDGNTALMLAVIIGNFPVMQLMLETENFQQKLDVEMRNKEGETVLLAAAKMMDSKGCKLLVDIGYASTDYIPEDLQKVLPRHARNRTQPKRQPTNTAQIIVPDNIIREHPVDRHRESKPAAEKESYDQFATGDQTVSIMKKDEELQKEEEALPADGGAIDDVIDEILAEDEATAPSAKHSPSFIKRNSEKRAVSDSEEGFEKNTHGREGQVSPSGASQQQPILDEDSRPVVANSPGQNRRSSQESVLEDLPSFVDKTKREKTLSNPTEDNDCLKSPSQPLPPVIVRRPSQNIIQSLTSNRIIPAMGVNQATDDNKSPSPTPATEGDVGQNPSSPARKLKEDRWVLMPDKKKGSVEVYKTKSGRIIHPNVKKGTQAMVVAEAIVKMRGKGRRGRGRGNPALSNRPGTQQSQAGSLYSGMQSPMKSKRQAKVFSTA